MFMEGTDNLVRNLLLKNKKNSLVSSNFQRALLFLLFVLCMKSQLLRKIWLKTVSPPNAKNLYMKVEGKENHYWISIKPECEARHRQSP